MESGNTVRNPDYPRLVSFRRKPLDLHPDIGAVPPIPHCTPGKFCRKICLLIGIRNLSQLLCQPFDLFVPLNGGHQLLLPFSRFQKKIQLPGLFQHKSHRQSVVKALVRILLPHRIYLKLQLLSIFLHHPVGSLLPLPGHQLNLKFPAVPVL